ncbi:hypothetical protein BUMB_03014c [Candidatus Paraburkholderia calva]|nr:hypothetical protein BUMB_03014c [Candidatus Paraburkholderia calva]
MPAIVLPTARPGRQCAALNAGRFLQVIGGFPRQGRAIDRIIRGLARGREHGGLASAGKYVFGILIVTFLVMFALVCDAEPLGNALGLSPKNPIRIALNLDAVLVTFIAVFRQAFHLLGSILWPVSIRPA